MRRCERSEATLNVKLYVRLLPTLDFNYDFVRIAENKKVLYVRCSQDLSKKAQVKNPNYWCFCTDGIFWNSCQSEVYETVASDILDDLFDGVSALILSFGQTGAGKTFTMSGLRFHYQNRGLALRILSQLFEEEEKRRCTTKTTFGLSYVEFLGENMKDLIGNKTVKNARDIIEYPMPDETWAWKQIFTAECRKSYAESAPYKGSNRGHSVLTFHIHAESLIDTDPENKHSKIHLVDMGGIDNARNKSSAWKNKMDLKNSNLTKCLMEQLILCLTGDTWKTEGHICPYKSCKFLIYLHNIVGPKSNMRFIAHIYGNDANLPISLSTLKFGEKILNLKPTKLERILESKTELYLRNLEREYVRMKEEAETTAMLADAPNDCIVSEERYQQIKRAAEGYLMGQLESLTLLNLSQASITLDVFRELYQKLSAEKDQVVKDAVATATELLQAQLAVDRNSSTSLPAVSINQKMSRRRSSRQQDSQYSLGLSLRSSESGQIPGKVSTVQPVGVTDRKGISIGPGKITSNFEGNITKAFKKLKCRKSEVSVLKSFKTLSTKDVAISTSKNQSGDEYSELPLPQNIPTRESAWQLFTTERGELVREHQASVENREGITSAARKKYTNAINELIKLREELQESKEELENRVHILQVSGKGNFDEEGNLIPEDTDKAYLDAIAHKEDQINAAVENCHVALVDFRQAVEDLNEAKKALEEAFQAFCKENFKTFFMPDDLASIDLKSEESGKETLTESELKNRARMKLYIMLHEKLMNFVPKKTKKAWKNF